MRSPRRQSAIKSSTSLLRVRKRTLPCPFSLSILLCLKLHVLNVFAALPHVTGNASVALQNKKRICNLVHKIAVVANNQKAAGKTGKELLKNIHRKNIKVVGGFIQNQKVGIGKKKPHKKKPLPLTAAQSSNR